jgi:hypothetical protein
MHLPPDQTELASQWAEDYPGHSHTTQALREILISNDLQRRRMQHSVDLFHAMLDTRPVPMHLWPRDLMATYRHLLRQNSDAQRQFIRALKPLQTQTQSKPTNQPNEKREPIEPAPPPNYYQTISVSIVNGETITKIPDFPAAHWLKRGPLRPPAVYTRQLCFDGGIVPPEYDYVRTHKEKTHPHARAFFITYAQEEFLRLCKLELESSSAHVLDGERLDHWRLD